MSTTPKKLGFEPALAELEELVARMESGNLPLEEALRSFERGVKLTRECQVALQAAQQRVSVLVQRPEGAVIEDFDVADEKGVAILIPALASAHGTTTFPARVATACQRIEAALARALSSPDPAVARLLEAMRYSVLGGGKRLRPLLVYLSGEALGAQPPQLDAPAVAVELIHAYSLIHDDLPAMDDDDLRRGQPTCHRAFDEGTAILAGDALQAMAFAVLASGGPGLSDPARVQMMTVLAEAIGTQGMAGGQAIDLAAVGHRVDAQAIEVMHRRKTGALIRASVELGAIAAGWVEAARRVALRRYGEEIGLAFQIQDDILDVTGETQVLGKRAGADAARAKPTYPSVLGLARAQELARAHRDQALAALGELGTAAAALRELAHLVVDRVS